MVRNETNANAGSGMEDSQRGEIEYSFRSELNFAI